MFKNYIKVGIRNLLKHKVFSFINIFGLALAMSISMLIILMLADQKRYDAFHVKKDRIYRILSTSYATSPYPLASTLETEYTIVEDALTITPGVDGDATYQEKMTGMRGYFADPSFFAMFSFELEKGDKANALVKPNSMVISQAMAKQLFKDEDPIGKVVEFADHNAPAPQDTTSTEVPTASWGSFTITGVINELAYKSHLKFDVLVSASSQPQLIAKKKINDLSNNWENFFSAYTYVLLKEGASSDDLASALNDLRKRKYATIQAEHTKDLEFLPQHLANVQLQLSRNDTGNRLPLFGYYFLAGLAFVVMVSACFNYTNLSIARALTRSKEIGVRKVTGAIRKNLVFQFLSESVITTLMALLMAGIMLWFIASAFKGLWLNQYLNFELPFSFTALLLFFVLALFIGIIAGFYPALYLSKFQPVRMLKNMGGSGSGKSRTRRVLIIAQFVLTLFFITTSVLIYEQFKHYMAFDYGFNSENIVNIELQGNDYRRLAHELSNEPGVTDISASDLVPSAGANNNTQIRKVGSNEDHRTIGVLIADENFTRNLGIEIIAKRNLLSEGENSNRYILVNESAVRDFGYQSPSEIIGEVFESKWNNEQLEVVGVVKDFRYKSLMDDDKIGPLYIRNLPANFEYANVKLSTKDLRSTLSTLERAWQKIDPAHPFKYAFFDEQLESTHRGIFDIVSILGFISFLSIVIACLGLLGMATYTAERKTKEVGIRKVLGAGSFNIVFMLSRSYLVLLGLSVGIGAPLSYIINNLWLQRLPNRVEFGVGTVLIAVFALLTLGLLTIGSQTLRASKRNPVDSLRIE